MRHAFDDCLLDTDTLTLTRSGTPVPVEPQAFDLIRLLVENAGRVVTRDEIVAAVWGGRIVSESAISARIAAARKAVGCDGKTQAVILHSRRDAVHRLSEAQKPAAGIPGAERVALDCRNHIPMPGNPAYEPCMAALTAFLGG